ncbi:uncharacterized protein LOC120884066 [Ictidomys tridecemlineatus]
MARAVAYQWDHLPQSSREDRRGPSVRSVETAFPAAPTKDALLPSRNGSLREAWTPRPGCHFPVPKPGQDGWRSRLGGSAAARAAGCRSPRGALEGAPAHPNPPGRAPRRRFPEPGRAAGASGAGLGRGRSWARRRGLRSSPPAALGLRGSRLGQAEHPRGDQPRRRGVFPREVVRAAATQRSLKDLTAPFLAVRPGDQAGFAGGPPERPPAR